MEHVVWCHSCVASLVHATGKPGASAFASCKISQGLQVTASPCSLVGKWPVPVQRTASQRPASLWLSLRRAGCAEALGRVVPPAGNSPRAWAVGAKRFRAKLRGVGICGSGPAPCRMWASRGLLRNAESQAPPRSTDSNPGIGQGPQATPWTLEFRRDMEGRAGQVSVVSAPPGCFSWADSRAPDVQMSGAEPETLH